MNTYSIEKQEIQQKVEKLKASLLELLPASSQLKALNELKEDLHQDYYTIMVVGEFKHGKSTFVNALLGADIMPRDVTPTTATINAVFHSEKEKLEIVKMDGQMERRELSSSELNKFTASADFNSNEIKYLKLMLDAPLLKNRAVLIDTPGVNDLNQQRADITYQFFPRADVIILLTSMDGAIKQTEKTFINDVLLKIGLEKIIFAANFMDRIDEDELDDTIDYMERRLQTIVEMENIPLYPISAKDALEGKLKNNQALVSTSGILEIEKEIKNRIESGSRSIEKMERFKWRLANIVDVIQSEIETAQNASAQSLESLKNQLASIAKWFENQIVWKNQLKTYLTDSKSETKYMVRKSVKHFGNRVMEDVENRILLYQGADIKVLIQTQIPITVRSQFTQWVEQYGDYIQELLRKTQVEVSKGLSNAFKKSVQIQSYKRENIYFSGIVPILQAKTGNAHVKAGLVMGGVSTVALLFGAPFFLPLIGMAGLPIFSQKMAAKQFEIVKPELISGAQAQIKMLLDDLENQLDLYIDRAISEIEEQALEEFARFLHSYDMILKDEINNKNKETAEIMCNTETLQLFNQFLNKEYIGGEEVK